VLRNVRVREKRDLATLPSVTAAVRDAEARLQGHGRVLLRYSGTEALARVMVEGPDAATIDIAALAIADALVADLGPAEG